MATPLPLAEVPFIAQRDPLTKVEWRVWDQRSNAAALPMFYGGELQAQIVADKLNLTFLEGEAQGLDKLEKQGE